MALRERKLIRREARVNLLVSHGLTDGIRRHILRRQGLAEASAVTVRQPGVTGCIRCIDACEVPRFHDKADRIARRSLADVSGQVLSARGQSSSECKARRDLVAFFLVRRACSTANG